MRQLLDLAKATALHPFLATAAYTGMRFSEVLRLRWADVDFKARKVLARGHKGSTTEQVSPRLIPLHPELARILDEHRHRAPGANLFGDAHGGSRSREWYYKQLRKLTKGTTFEGIGFHALRHSFASNLAAAGVDQRLIDSFLGHQTEAMRKRYQHLFPETQQEAIQQLGF